jgi:hypothetical protein
MVSQLQRTRTQVVDARQVDGEAGSSPTGTMSTRYMCVDWCFRFLLDAADRSPAPRRPDVQWWHGGTPSHLRLGMDDLPVAHDHTLVMVERTSNRIHRYATRRRQLWIRGDSSSP